MQTNSFKFSLFQADFRLSSFFKSFLHFYRYSRRFCQNLLTCLSCLYSRGRISFHFINVFMLYFEVKVSQRYFFFFPVLSLWGVPCRWLKQSSGMVTCLWDAPKVQYCPLKSLSEQYCLRIFSSNWSFDQ